MMSEDIGKTIGFKSNLVIRKVSNSTFKKITRDLLGGDFKDQDGNVIGKIVDVKVVDLSQGLISIEGKMNED